MKRDCLIHVLVLNSVASLRLNLVVELVVLVLDMAHKSLTLVHINILVITRIIVVESIKPAFLIIVSL